MVRTSSGTGVRTLLSRMALFVTVVMCFWVVGFAGAVDDDVDKNESERGVILNALTFGAGPVGINISLDGCEWRRGQTGQQCPDPGVKFYLYTSYGSPRRELNPEGGANALMAAGWVQQHHTIVLIHGYGGGDNTLPISILRDAYLHRGDFNVIVVDWGALAPVPCYPAAVHNAAHVGKCVAAIPKMLRDGGANADAWTCVGHSLGAHVCATMSDHLSFRVHKIIGLDPARPLVRSTTRFRLDASDAAVVHVLHTDAGHYGELGKLGTVDFCVNGGRTQPHCRNSMAGEHVCNHVSAVCFLAESLDPSAALLAEQCSTRRCPAVRLRPGVGYAGASSETAPAGGQIHMGQYSPDSASGTYCTTSHHQPYCPRKPGDRGHPKCCVVATGDGDNSVSPILLGEKHDPEPLYAPGFIEDPANKTPPTIPPSLPAENRSADMPDDPPPSSVETTFSVQAHPTYELTTETPITSPLSPPSSHLPSLPSTPPPSSPPPANRAESVVLILPSTELTTPSTPISPKDQEPVFPVYSTVAETSTGRVLVVMATPLKNTSLVVAPPMTVTTSAPPMSSPHMDPSPFLPVHFSPSPRPFSPVSFPGTRFPPPPPFAPHEPPQNPSALASDQMFLMTDMLPPNPTAPQDVAPHLPPVMVPLQESAPTTAPGAPDDGDSPIPMAGSLTGPWVPMVMLPPTPFSTDSWKIRSASKLVAMPPVRRSTYRNYIYE